jgi:pimeloyl-ACP methyl ester carboxylesterase
LIAGAEIARIDGAGHMLTVERPRAVADAIAKFLE